MISLSHCRPFVTEIAMDDFLLKKKKKTLTGQSRDATRIHLLEAHPKWNSHKELFTQRKRNVSEYKFLSISHADFAIHLLEFHEQFCHFCRGEGEGLTDENLPSHKDVPDDLIVELTVKFEGEEEDNDGTTIKEEPNKTLAPSLNTNHIAVNIDSEEHNTKLSPVNSLTEKEVERRVHCQSQESCQEDPRPDGSSVNILQPGNCCDNTYHTPKGIHPGEKPYQCTHCHKQFTYFEDMKKHERIHLGEKPYKCKYCDERLICSSDDAEHERTLTCDRPYKCKYCSKSFSDFMTHENVHTGFKLYQCKHYDKSFSQACTHQAHERTHTGEKLYLCKHCDESFSQASTHQSHERTDTGETLYLCMFCGKSFDTASYLKSHERIHIGDKMCIKSFAKANDLKKMHGGNHTGDK